MKQELHWQTLKERRQQAKVTMLYKIRTGTVAIQARFKEFLACNTMKKLDVNDYGFVHLTLMPCEMQKS